MSFSVGCGLSFVLGAGLYGSIYLLALFLGLVRGHSPLAIGEIMIVTGISRLLMAPVAALLEVRMRPRLLTAIGFVLFLAGRVCGSAVISQFKPQRVLTTYAILCAILTAAAMAGGKLGMYGIFGTFFFMSIMFPTIFALGIRGLGDHTKLASSIIVMSIVGGAIAPPLMGYIADRTSMRVGFAVPLICFALIAVYGAFWQKLEDKDREA